MITSENKINFINDCIKYDKNFFIEVKGEKYLCICIDGAAVIHRTDGNGMPVLEYEDVWYIENFKKCESIIDDVKPFSITA